MNKVAVDQAAKDYWKLLYGEYGEALVRDIPRRIKAALLENKKVAMINEAALLLPVAHAKSGEDLLIEGIYKDASTKLMFHVSLDKEGNVKGIKSFELR
jgi:hypothetical protein